jgi:hypothetical protein
LGLSTIDTPPVGEIITSRAMTAVAAQAPNPTRTAKVLGTLGIQPALKRKYISST